MQTKLCVVLLALGLSQVLAMPSPTLQFNNPSTDLMHFLMQSRDLNSDSDHSIDCLAHYVPLLNDAVSVYEEDFKACLEESAQEVSGINNKTNSDRVAIDALATSSCDALTVCSQKEAASDYFQCYSEAGTNNTKSMFTISANASALHAVVLEDLRLIKVNEYVCTNQTQRAYGETSGQLYQEMNLCFAGAPIPSATPSTEAPSTESSTDSSSDSSSASTESSSSAEPESSTDSSSAAPESSTDSSSAAPESSTDSSSAEPESSTDSSSAAPESSTDSSTAEPESSTDSSSAAPESSTDSSSAEPESSTDSSSAAPESSTDSSTAEPESSSAEPESSTDSSSAAPESSTDSSTAEPESSTSSGDNKESFPEEDLKSASSQKYNDVQQLMKSLREWLKTQ